MAEKQAEKQANKQIAPMSQLAPPTDADIRIVGLGPGALEDLTLAAWQLLTAGGRVVARTRQHPCLAQLAEITDIESFDDLYEQHDEFAAVYAAITQRVVALGREPGGVTYAVPGHPWVGEATTPLIQAAATEAGLSVSVTGGLSFVPPTFAAVGVDLMDGGQVVDAMLLAKQHHPKADVSRPLLVGQLYVRWLASDVKLTLLNAYPDDHTVAVIRAAGTPQEQVRRLPLYELDRSDDFDHLTSLVVPPLDENGSFTDLQEIVAHLRAPEGCPWDREQTLESLRQDLLGECAEVLEAIDLEADGSDNSLHIAEELGDLMLVATMMVQIATEEERFHMADVMRAIVTKLIRRHPHVFGETEVAGVGEVLTNWDAIKAEERKANGQAAAGPLDGVPAHLPALEKARALQKKAAKVGLLDRQALARSLPPLVKLLGDSPDAEAVGKLLWAAVALAHEHDVNAEDALRSYAAAFRRQHEG